MQEAAKNASQGIQRISTRKKKKTRIRKRRRNEE